MCGCGESAFRVQLLSSGISVTVEWDLCWSLSTYLTTCNQAPHGVNSTSECIHTHAQSQSIHVHNVPMPKRNTKKCKWYTASSYRYMAFLGPSVTMKLFGVVPKVALARFFWATPSWVISCLQGPMWLSETLCLPVKLCTFSPRVPQIPSGPANYSPNLLIMWQVLWLELGSEVCVSRAGPLTSTATLGTHPSAGGLSRQGGAPVEIADRQAGLLMGTQCWWAQQHFQTKNVMELHYRP